MFFNSIKEVNRLRKEISRISNKGMSNIYLKVTIEKNEVLKTSSESKNFLLQLKKQRSGGKYVCSFSIILILKGIMTFKCQGRSPCILLKKI